MSAILALPPELFDAILLQVPPASLQQTVLSLTRALPRAPIPIYHLFRHIRLRHADQAVYLYRRLRGSDDSSLVHGLYLDTWTVDADVVVNVMHLLPQLSQLNLCIGPNFAPEHLQDIFEEVRPNLRLLSLRFRPYVQRATYYQFLKGAYFDTFLIALSEHPLLSLKTLSIIQDPLDPELTTSQRFAQPLVFFRLDPLTTLVRSLYLRSVTNFRLRVPSRQIARFVSPDGALPNLEFLDLSTSNIVESDLEGILERLGSVRHLVLDGCSLLRGAAREGEWAGLGKICALAGVKRAKEREKSVKAWLEANALISIFGQDEAAAVLDAHTDTPRRPHKGRRGLATSTLSLRASPPRREAPAWPARASSSGNGLDSSLKPNVQKIRILPSAPSLVSLATTNASTLHADAEKLAQFRVEFERGWGEGLGQINSIRSRLRQSRANGIRVMRMIDVSGRGVEEEDDKGMGGMRGLVDLDRDDDYFDDVRIGKDEGRCPVLCLVGPGRKEGHAEGCGHAIGWEVWDDEL